MLNPHSRAPLAALDVVQPGLGGEFVAHVGTTMALAAAMPQDWFPKTGAPIAAVSPTVGLDRPEFFAKQNRPGPLVWSVKSGYCPRQMILDQGQSFAPASTAVISLRASPFASMARRVHAVVQQLHARRGDEQGLGSEM